MADDAPENLPAETGPAAQRASDADRESVVERLRDATAEGRLDLDEFEERITAAFRARTYGELAPLTTDLPTLAPRQVSQEVTVRAHGSAIRREGRWAVPRRIVVEARSASVRLDLTEAEILSREVEIVTNTQHSSVVVVVPAGTHADTGALATTYSSAKVRAGGSAPSSGLRIQVSGEIRHSSVVVRPRSGWERFRRRFGPWWHRRFGER